tara:strand:- start:327 stop:776 length:450 start_codon:yes stop_codon:yes gene_type:complete
MVSLVQKLIAELELIIDEFPELFLVDLIVKGVSGKQFVLVLIDSEVGLSIEMCSLISRKLLSKIEEKSLIEGAFNLEVSSPGIDRPISLPRQFKKNIGRKLEIETLDGETFKGKLKKIEDQKIALYLRERVEIIFLNKIKKAKVLISFN